METEKPVNTESNVDRDIAREIAEALENGDLFDEDLNEHLTQIELKDNTPPAKISVFCNGFMYVYKIDSRYGIEKGEPVIQSKDQYSNL